MRLDKNLKMRILGSSSRFVKKNQKLFGSRNTRNSKYKESSLVTHTLSYLQCQENLGKIVHCDRTNSGRVKVTSINKVKQLKTYYIRLLRKGTADAFFIRNDGKMVWMEMKRNEQDEQSPDQKEFEEKMTRAGHDYLVVRSVDDVVKYLSHEGG